MSAATPCTDVRALVSQVGHLGFKYESWVWTPDLTHHQMRFFEHPMLELLSWTPWYARNSSGVQRCKKLRIVTLRDFGWQIAHGAVTRRRQVAYTPSVVADRVCCDSIRVHAAHGAFSCMSI